MSKSVNPGTSTYSCHFDRGLNIIGICTSFAAFAADAACGLPVVVEGRLLIVQHTVFKIELGHARDFRNVKTVKP